MKDIQINANVTSPVAKMARAYLGIPNQLIDRLKRKCEVADIQELMAENKKSRKSFFVQR